jgi:hypothetical protein
VKGSGRSRQRSRWDAGGMRLISGVRAGLSSKRKTSLVANDRNAFQHSLSRVFSHNMDECRKTWRMNRLSSYRFCHFVCVVLKTRSFPVLVGRERNAICECSNHVAFARLGLSGTPSLDPMVSPNAVQASVS